MTAFFAGLAVGAMLAVIVLALAQNAGKLSSFTAGDKVREETAQAVESIDRKKEEAHAAIDKLTPEEMDRVLNGSATLDDVMRERAAAAQGGEPPS